MSRFKSINILKCALNIYYIVRNMYVYVILIELITNCDKENSADTNDKRQDSVAWGT